MTFLEEILGVCIDIPRIHPSINKVILIHPKKYFKFILTRGYAQPVIIQDRFVIIVLKESKNLNIFLIVSMSFIFPFKSIFPFIP